MTALAMAIPANLGHFRLPEAQFNLHCEAIRRAVRENPHVKPEQIRQHLEPVLRHLLQALAYSRKEAAVFLASEKVYYASRNAIIGAANRFGIPGGRKHHPSARQEVQKQQAERLKAAMAKPAVEKPRQPPPPKPAPQAAQAPEPQKEPPFEPLNIPLHELGDFGVCREVTDDENRLYCGLPTRDKRTTTCPGHARIFRKPVGKVNLSVPVTRASARYASLFDGYR